MSLNSYRGYITGASGSQGLVGPQASWRVYVLPRGAHASLASTGTLITVDSTDAASRFAVNNWIQAGLQTANIRQVSAVGGNSFSVSGAALTVAANDRIYLIGNTQPTVSGGSATYLTPNTTIRSRDDDAGTTYANSMLTTDSNGMFEFFSLPAIYDAIVQDSNQSNQMSLIDIEVGAVHGISATEASYFGSAGITSTGTAYFGATTTIGGELRLTRDIVDLADGTAYAILRVGGRAQTTGDNRTLGYFSETFDNDIADTNDRGETVAVYGINQYQGNLASGCEAIAIQGEVQYAPTAAKTASASMYGGQLWARYASTHPSSTAAFMRGANCRFVVSSGSTGTITNAGGLAITAPSIGSTVAITTFQNFSVAGPAAGAATGMNATAVFSSGDDDAVVIFRGNPIRWDDSFNNGNDAADGRIFDAYKTIVGNSNLTTFYSPFSLGVGVSGSFTAGDDIYAHRVNLTTPTTSGAGANIDVLAGTRADVTHASDQIIDEIYGLNVNVTVSGTSNLSLVNTTAGFVNTITASGVTVGNAYGALLNSLTPSAAIASAGHMRLVPVSTATPSTTLALMSSAQDGTMIFLTDSNNADNSGLYIRINSKWLCLVAGQSTFRQASDS